MSRGAGRGDLYYADLPLLESYSTPSNIPSQSNFVEKKIKSKIVDVLGFCQSNSFINIWRN